MLFSDMVSRKEGREYDEYPRYPLVTRGVKPEVESARGLRGVVVVGKLQNTSGRGTKVPRLDRVRAIKEPGKRTGRMSGEIIAS